MNEEFFAYLASHLRRFPLPPEGFDAMTATPDELQKLGLGVRPDSRLEPALFEFWARMFKAPLKFIEPQFPQPLIPDLAEYQQRPLGVERQRRGSKKREKSRNWSGVYVRPRRGERLLYVTGRWRVPTPAPPAREPSDVVPGGEYHASVWVGIDGRRTFPDASLPQIGTTQIVKVVGAQHVVSFNVWWQWWVRDRPVHHRPVEILNFPVAAGDEMLASLAVLPGDHVLFHLKNETAGTFVAFAVARPAGVIPLGSTAEWIVERPTKVNDTRMYPLPDFGEVVFYDCAARSVAAGGGLGTPQDLERAGLIRMYEVFDRPARIAFVSLPEKLSPTSARVAFA